MTPNPQIEVKYRKHGEYVVKYKGKMNVVGRIAPDENGKYRYTDEAFKVRGEPYETVEACVKSLGWT